MAKEIGGVDGSDCDVVQLPGRQAILGRRYCRVVIIFSL